MVALVKKESWAVRVREGSLEGVNDSSSGDSTVIIGEIAEERMNSTYIVEDSTKAKVPFMLRIAPSTSTNTANSNIEKQTTGTNYGHISNTFISGASNQTSNAVSVVRGSVRRSSSTVERVNSRSRSRGKS